MLNPTEVLELEETGVVRYETKPLRDGTRRVVQIVRTYNRISGLPVGYQATMEIPVTGGVGVGASDSVRQP